MALTHNETRSNYLINQIAREIGAIVGHENVTQDKAKRIEQASDWSWMSKYLLSKNEELPIADLVVSPKSTEEVSKVVALANDYRMPVIPRGGGSGTQSGTFALYGGIALDLKRLNKVIDIDENSMIVTVEAGLDGSELEKVLNAKGLTMPHYPGSHFFVAPKKCEPG
jgi:alkyldihydroxyacetonephosphate synthase